MATIVTQDEKYAGIVRVKSLLLKMAEAQVKMARLMNPLSFLPGNHLIEEKFNEALSYPICSILCFDLDRFKVFNNIYGFKRGDNFKRVRIE